MKAKIKTFVILIVIATSLIAGCISKSTPESNTTPIATTAPTPAPTSSTTSQDKETIQNLESRITALESQVSDINAIMKYNGIMKQSEKSLIPEPPFSIIVTKTGEGKNKTYFFRKDNITEITEGNDPFPFKANYETDSMNNTIKLIYVNVNAAKLPIFNFNASMRLRVFDDYIASTFENGGIEWVGRYEIKTNSTPPVIK